MHKQNAERSAQGCGSGWTLPGSETDLQEKLDMTFEKKPGPTWVQPSRKSRI